MRRKTGAVVSNVSQDIEKSDNFIAFSLRSAEAPYFSDMFDGLPGDRGAVSVSVGDTIRRGGSDPMKTVETAFGTFAIDEADRSVSRVLVEKGEYGLKADEPKGFEARWEL